MVSSRDLSAAKQRIKNAVDYTFGGIENAVQDGDQSWYPKADELVQDVFLNLLSRTYEPGSEIWGRHPSISKIPTARIITLIAEEIENIDRYSIPMCEEED